ncbi:MAG TPA: sulfatase-like hydrolase/transferase [Aggregatilinea sp.]|uniref:sulfatase-like hydrolase/transferase n=1 Tax=Aggregatilinea sp. TaxID=2806333 RepID=UPI002B5262F9|nr:sulfatase-like hydrolase/transferase [Aggregatilinea sp.]HML20286.1 sulfatase-like hydrolase/transferase [Aggregatilinea sp.]
MPPNILLILTDQQRTDTLGFRGQAPCRTPHVDRLAAEGISFDRAICTAPLCSPSRASIFSAQYPHQVDMMTNHGTLSVPPHLTDPLKARGYYTAYAGKAHLQPEAEPANIFGSKEEQEARYKLEGFEFKPENADRVIARWFDRVAGENQSEYVAWCEENSKPNGFPYADPRLRTHRQPAMSIPKTAVMEMDVQDTIDGWITNHALRFFEERPRGQPFFLVCSYVGPHPPFKVPEPYYSMYDPADILEPPNFHDGPNKPRANETSFYHQLWLDHGDDWASWQKSMAVYWGYCTMIDDQVGLLLGALEAEGVLDETLVIFASDHGEMLGSHGLWHKMMPYEEAIRVPLVMRLPGTIPAGVRSDAVTSLIDIAPTILSVCREAVPPEYVGRDLSPAFADGAEFQADAYRFAEHKPLGEWHATVEFRLVVDDRYKYVWNQGDLNELYDLQTDPYELDNLIDRPKHAATQTRLRARLAQWMYDTDDPLREAFEKEVS